VKYVSESGNSLAPGAKWPESGFSCVSSPVLKHTLTERIINTPVKKILVGLTFCVGGVLLAMNSLSHAFSAKSDNVTSEQALAAMSPTDRFASNTNYCKAFIAAQDVGADSATPEFAAALSAAVHSNGDDATRTFSMLREKCKAAA
jgi:hypothetical protein